jgi:predicted kinase
MQAMPTSPPPRSVKIANDERGGWSSDRPRPGGPRPADLSTRCRILRPGDRMRYSPGSLLLVLGTQGDERDAFAERVVDERGAVLSRAKVRRLLEGRVEAGQLDARADELLDAAVAKRLGAGESVVVSIEGLEPEERDRFVRPAAALRRPRHVLLIETSKDRVEEADRSALNELRRRLDSGELGAEGVQTALRVNAASAAEVKRILFRPAPRDDD